MKIRFLLLILTDLALFTIPVTAAVWDSDKEKLIAEQLTSEIDSGRVLWLKPLFSNEFPAIFTSAGPYARRTAIILLHGMGGHPDWPVVISPLRHYLQVHHWTTLSIQLPVLEAGRSPADYGKTLKESGRRIDRAIAFLDGKNYQHVVLLGYGFGAATALSTLVNEKKPAVSGFIGISVLARKFLDPGIDVPGLLAKTSVPVLDIYAVHDKPVVIDTADDRRLAAGKTSPSRFTQVMLPGTDHYYSGQEHTLLKQILDWLELEINSDADSDPE